MKIVRAFGSAARSSTSSSFTTAASRATVSVGSNSSFAFTMMSSGPTCCVRSAIDADDLADAPSRTVAHLLDDLGRGRLAHEQARHLDREQDRDDHEQHADREAADRVPARLVEHARERDADQREREPDERADVFEHDDRELGDLRAAHELEDRLARAARARLSRIAVRSENDSSTTATRSTAIAIRGSSSSCGWISFSMPSKIANNPPTLNSTSATTNAQK